MESEMVTIIGFGSLLSKKSALMTTPSMQGFQYVRVKGYQRQFAHPAPIFFERGAYPGIAKPDTKEIASLSTRPSCESSFVACAYQIPKSEWEPLAEREEEFEFIEAAFEPLEKDAPSLGKNVGLMCTRSNDDKLKTLPIWQRYERCLSPYGEVKVWSWEPDSGIRPCPVYCRHCVLATQKEGVPEYVSKSFLDETFLVDGKTTLREYLEHNPHVMLSEPPEEFRERYCG
ncbi:unnamed protein product [Effrenium voratum]|uniref:Gamma-glutamylcyclotransferase n=1 Tax=Effrenium voratum TaxID=2562239 RepID=A0AA36NFY1_9DINO|nr:unnamed protein product [Effrenium voratum]CAJ1429874.1 unnamed protein product [Effrenium voratum]